MIIYASSIEGITTVRLSGFFVGWPNPPSPEILLKILRKSYKIVLAIDDRTGQVVGFSNALSDGVLSAYIPLLEVLPEYQSQGIGSEIMRRMLALLEDLYMIDLTCDEARSGFYERLGMRVSHGTMIRNFSRQSGAD